MSKAVLMSVQPKWCEKICHKIGENADGSPIYEKRVEVRKTRPKLDTPFKVYIYCTKAKEFFVHGGIRETLDDLYRLPSGEIKYGYSGELMCYGEDEYDENNFLNGKVIGEFVCNQIDTYDDDTIHAFSREEYSKWNDFDLYNSCIHPEDFEHYANDNWLYGWHISDLVIYDEPKELNKFYNKCEKMPCEGCEHLKYQKVNSQEYDWDCEYFNYQIPITRPPQSWCYVEELSKWLESEVETK